MKVRPATSDDFPQWLALWNANNQGYKDEDVTTKTWSRITNDGEPVYALMAEDAGELVGLLQYIVHPTTGNVLEICYMQDVYVVPERRKQGVARAMIAKLEALGKTEKWGRIYWLAENDNEAAQALYKSLGQKMDFSLHILPLKG